MVGSKIDFYNDGNSFVELIDFMGNDHSILRAARVSTGGVAEKSPKEDRGLIRYLWRNKHSSPFEMATFTFHAKIPMFVATQLNRHRTFSFNYYSQRYSPTIRDYYTPEEFREQGEKNHQGSGPPLKPELNEVLNKSFTEFCEGALKEYDKLIESGVSREMARMVLPENVYTECYFTVDLRNLLHFLELRLHEHAQEEIRSFAKAIYKILKSLDEFAWSVEAFEDYSLNSVTYTCEENTLLRDLLNMLTNQAPSLLGDSKVKAVLQKVGVVNGTSD